jgi:hypothetical protein
VFAAPDGTFKRFGYKFFTLSKKGNKIPKCERKKTMKRRILAILLAAIMVLSAVPFSVFAEEATVACPGKGEIHTKDNCDSEWFADVAPVCNKPGYSVYTCLNPECGDQFIVITKEASNTPHTLVSATKAPDCNNAGIKENVWQCTACKSYFKDADAKEEYTDKS